MSAAQLVLPGLHTKKGYPLSYSYVRVEQLSVEDGLRMIHAGEPLYKYGVSLGISSAANDVIRHRHTTECVCCKAKVTHFYLEYARGDEVHNRLHLHAYCTRADGAEDIMTMDHIIPKSIGGTESMHNSQLMCRTCNATKGNQVNVDDLLVVYTSAQGVSASRLRNAIKRYGPNKNGKIECPPMHEAVRTLCYHIRRNAQYAWLWEVAEEC